MFGGHIWELALVLIIALVVFGPKRLPEIGGAMGKSIREFKKGTTELEDLITSHDAGPSEQIPTAEEPVVSRASTARDREVS